MMVRVIKELDEYEHVVVTLFPGNNFGEELQCKKWICLNINSLFALPLAFFKFKKLVKAEKPKVNEELAERKSLLDTRSTVMTRQEERIRSQVKEAQTKLQEDLSPVSGQPLS